MKAGSSILFLSLLALSASQCRTDTDLVHSKDCGNKKFQDSLIVRYIDSGANKLPYRYNNPAWGSFMDSVLAICPEIAEAYQLKGVPAIKNGEYTKAYYWDEKAAALDSAQFVSYVGFLKCIFTKDYTGAILDFKRANKIVPGGAEMDHSFYFYLGICYLELKNYREAEINFNTDIFFQTKANPAADIHYNSLLFMGITKLENNEPDSAKIYLNKCLSIYREHPEANYYLAQIYKKENQVILQRKYFQIAQKSLLEGYSMNEDNLYYVNYPHQISLYEVNQELSAPGFR